MKLIPLDQYKEMKWFNETARVAANSLCLRAKCGAVIVKYGKIIGEGFNSPPQNNPELRTCLNEYEIPAGFRHDRTCCIHAEQRAIQDAIKKRNDMESATIYFVCVDENGDKVKATALKCTICSRAALEAGIREFALCFEDGIRIYPTDEFNRISYEYKTPKIIG
ncbi:hypothetical protein HYW53_00100 [Candidatus Giovannonibacteria bacterium]|nr:hypothetical protein [Candidatus Giovannonibacteria bacterium]